MIGLLFIIAGLIVWLAAGYLILGLVLIVVGVLLMFAPWPGAYGFGYYRSRRGPPA